MIGYEKRDHIMDFAFSILQCCVTSAPCCHLFALLSATFAEICTQSPVVIKLLFQEKDVQALTSGWFHCIPCTLRSAYKVLLVISNEGSFVVTDYQQECVILAR